MRNRCILVLLFLVSFYSSNASIHAKDSLKISHAFLLAVYNNQMDSALYYLKKGASVNYQSDGMTALHYATMNQNLDMVKLLDFHKANLNKANNERFTPLIFAAQVGAFDIGEYLAFRKVSLIAKDIYGAQALHYAVAYDDYYFTDMLLFYGAHVNAKTKDLNTPLHLAALNNDTALVQLLIRHKAKIFTLNSKNRTPLDIAIRNHNNKVVQLLLTSYPWPEDILDSMTLLCVKTANDSALQLLLKAKNTSKDEFKKLYNSALIVQHKESIEILKALGLSPSIWPVFVQLQIQYGMTFNRDNAFYELNYGLRDIKYQLELQLAMGSRLKYKPVLVQKNETEFYQYWERRSYMSLGLAKTFSLHKLPHMGLKLGFGKEIYFGRLRGSGSSITSPNAWVYQMNMTYQYQELIAGIGYHYRPLHLENISNHYIAFYLGYRLNNQELINKSKPDWL